MQAQLLTNYLPGEAVGFKLSLTSPAPWAVEIWPWLAGGREEAICSASVTAQLSDFWVRGSIALALLKPIAAVPAFLLHLLRRRQRPREGWASCQVTQPFPQLDTSPPPGLWKLLVRKNSGTYWLISERKCRFQWCLTHISSTC